MDSESTAAHITQPAPSQADLLYAAQLRRVRQFRMNVVLSWIVLLLLLFLVFSSLEFKSANGVTQLSNWQYEEVLQDGKKILRKTETVLFSLPFGLPGNGISLTTITIDRNFIAANFRFIASGLYWTLRISLLSIGLATLLALLAALGRLSTFPPIFALSTFYVSLIRGTPLYLQILFFFLALPQLDIRLSGEAAGVLALGLNYGAYMSEIFRAGLSSVGKGQR
jgi:His/Glu/Gln/Arg/opine family amino acid ABC transporter permease subunit